MGFLGLFGKRSGPKIKVQSLKKDGFSGWLNCAGCSDTIHANELIDQHNCCPRCGYHYRLSVSQRIKLICDEDSFQEMFTDIKTADPLAFVDEEEYPKRVKKAQEKSGRDEAVCVGSCTIEGLPVMLGVMDFGFMGGSMGSVVGDRFVLAAETALKEQIPLVCFAASGGARMQEGLLSLMQMARTAAAIEKLKHANIPYIVVLTNPVYGGVTASLAMLGDIHLAEPKAMIGFAGKRVIEQTVREVLGEPFQRAEFLVEHGVVDQVVHRLQMKETIHRLLKKMTYFRQAH
jgi:acetyl-CoA carboxylase carboxyl transferase subunit beta